MTNSEVILAITIIGLSIIMPVYYSYKKKYEKSKIEERLKESRYVTEKEKIRVYIDQINQKTREKYK